MTDAMEVSMHSEQPLPAADTDLDSRAPDFASVGKEEKGEEAAAAAAVAVGVAGDGPKPISKNQRKKLARLQHYADTREQWKTEKRDKKKAAKERKRQAQKDGGASTGLKRKADGEENEAGDGVGSADSSVEGSVEEPSERKKQKTQPKRVLEPITLIMDCGFDEKMNDKEIISMSSQLTRCYAFNRLSTHQVSLRVTSLNGRLLQRLQTAINSQHLRWKNVKFSDTDYEITDENRGDLIYLTADSPDTVEDLEAGKTYIIGGIVDRNRYKSLCYDKAVAQGIRTAKLPIGEYIKMSSRFVLTTNQVVEIMLKYLEFRDWKKAFMEVIPPRKLPTVRQQQEVGDGEGDEGGDGGGEEVQGVEGSAPGG
ncbi:tRNA (guanine(9)-N(1))-methyltransferase [Maublancomyces gigas]|uniref:tRNA (guanine(9)-N1)-methyltransferase n=1 Tax=Discina gigas TaxID=1032678 RepID=A0ABR3GPL2_9PEZI